MLLLLLLLVMRLVMLLPVLLSLLLLLLLLLLLVVVLLVLKKIPDPSSKLRYHFRGWGVCCVHGSPAPATCLTTGPPGTSLMHGGMPAYMNSNTNHGTHACLWACLASSLC